MDGASGRGSVYFKIGMRKTSDADEFLSSLPRLKQGESFFFTCGPNMPCFNACCGDLTLSLSPYDVIRLRAQSGMSSKAFFDEFATVSAMSGNGFPAVYLRMSEDESSSCPFVRESGCSVYPHRPGACRVYPLGRGACIDETGQIQPGPHFTLSCRTGMQ